MPIALDAVCQYVCWTCEPCGSRVFIFGLYSAIAKVDRSRRTTLLYKVRVAQRKFMLTATFALFFYSRILFYVEYQCFSISGAVFTCETFSCSVGFVPSVCITVHTVQTCAKADSRLQAGWASEIRKHRSFNRLVLSSSCGCLIVNPRYSCSVSAASSCKECGNMYSCMQFVAHFYFFFY